MANNGHGTENDYDTSSFRTLLKSTKQAVEEGFDIGILPEGQLNPNPEAGLLPAFSGAFTLAKMARRPIRMMGVHGMLSILQEIFRPT
jgi:1-acyl-sn-glycerol-3-phosphate acyltransferase